MSDDKNTSKVIHITKVANNSGSGAIYGLGIIGALIYFLQHADSFWSVILGIVKALFWPAVLVYKVLETWKL